MVPRVQLTPGGPELSAIVYGTWRLLDGGAPEPTVLAARFRAGLELGVTTIDTAEIYGGYQVEEAIGGALRASPDLRGRLEFVTKCGINVPSPRKPGVTVAHYDATADNIVRCAERSLQLLGLDVIDLFLVHRPDWLTPAAETAEGLSRLVADGKVRAVGVSNYTTHQFENLQSLLDIPLATNQIEFSLLSMGAIGDGTLHQCERTGVRPMAWSPLGGGRLFDPANPAGVRIREAMAAMRPRYGNACDTALAFAWVMAHPSRPLPVIGTNHPERVAEAAAAAEITLGRQDWYQLWEAAQGRRIP
jgi:predicted oxidoreductase